MAPAGAGRAALGEGDRLPAWRRWIRQNPKDALALGVASAATLTILINALFMQSGPHPAPIFANKPPAYAIPVPADSLLLPRGTPGEQPAVASGPPSSQTIGDIQSELAKRGFYSGTVDGIYGPATDAAIRDFEAAAGLRPSAQPNDVLLETLRNAQVKAKASASDPIAALLSGNRQVIAVQRALTDFGYGQIKPDGVIGPETETAIRSFEKERRLPVTGRISDRLKRELSAMTGRPLE